MKRAFRCLLLAFMLLLVGQQVTYAAGTNIGLRVNNQNIRAVTADVKVNGQALRAEFPPYIHKGRTFVTIRELTENMGAQVKWNPQGKSVDINLNGKSINLKINSTKVVVNGQVRYVEENATPRLATYSYPRREGKTVVPLRFVSEALGFNVKWDANKKLVYIDNYVDQTPAPSKPNSSKPYIVIDPGHGGSDSGAVSQVDGTYEKTLNIQVANRLKSLLEGAGYPVLMTRYGDEGMGLYERADLANEAGADIYLSIHFNSFGNSKPTGIETYYHDTKPEDQALADYIQAELIRLTGAYNRGVKTANFCVIRETDMTAALVELGFLSNPDDMAAINSPGYLDTLAQALYNGLVKYDKNY
ncbi:MAG: N-acetylmuramoyl-L-alanine amidase [Tissierellia bacterium]|nr:N-acetylmuramoyl-L-alanine amidase [Tissierellia bacterium]